MTKKTFEELLKIRLIKNTKLPRDKWGNKTMPFKGFNVHKSINTTQFNIGILTGKQNNLLVLDIDVKDDGINEFKKYIDEYGEPMTVKQQTPNKGFHYFFTFTHSDKKCEFLIQNYLTNKSKYRNKGLDIRSNNGYIVAAPSCIYDKHYKFIRNFDECELLEMPESLINFLLLDLNENKEKKTRTKKTIKQEPIIKQLEQNFKSNINDETIIYYLRLLPSKYKDNYSEWLIITTILKNENKFDIWDNWSKGGNNYSYENNIKIWNLSLIHI